MAAFPTTRWSLIHAKGSSPVQTGDTWGELVRAYYPAIQGYFRYSPLARDADDLAQEFMLRSISEDWWARADPGAGSFRTFLRMLLKRFLATQQYEGYRRFECAGEWPDEREESQSPERHFDLQFALCLTRTALADLQADYESDGNGELFAALQPWLVESPERGELVALGARLRVAPNTLAVQLKRLRSRFQKAVRVALRELSLDAEHAAADLDALRLSLATAGAH